MRRALTSLSLTARRTDRSRAVSTLTPATTTGEATKTNGPVSKPSRPVRRLRSPQEVHPSSKPRPRLRVADARVGALLASRTPPRTFISLCEELQCESDVELLAATDSTAWNVALQNRLRQNDVRGARALLDLVQGFEAENASEQLWSDLLFTLLRQRGAVASERDVTKLLVSLRRACGDDFVARVLVALVNGCANIKMFDEARLLLRYHRTLETSIEMPPRVLGHLVSTMQAKRRFQGVIDVTDDVLDALPLAHVQPQLWIALFRSCEQTQTQDLARRVDRVIEWFHAVQHDRAHQLERVFGAVVQTCVASCHERLALRVFQAMTEDDQHVRPDENIYVNMLKAARALHDDALFRDVYRQMVSAGVARSAGFGSAVRFCHERHDVALLEEVLDDAFATETDDWCLPLEQYNDALGCLAETKSFDLAKDLFAHLLENPRLTPDHITMVEMVENYREAPFSDVFELMEVFLEMQLTPNMHVFTSLLAACGRHRSINDAMALITAMQTQNVALDLKAFTALCFVYATHGHIAGIVHVLQDMEAQGMATDTQFFDVIMDGLYGANGIDLCFALFRETLAAGLPIPAGMYASLIRVGTNVGLVERTLHIAYNMECDGIPITSTQLLALMHRCEGVAEVAELARTFFLLHQGRAAADEEARFSAEVYEEMVALLTAFSQRDAIAKVKELAAAAGHDVL